MISLTLTLTLTRSLTVSSTINHPLARPSGFLSSLPTLKPALHRNKKLNQRRIRNGACRAEFSQDAPLAIAIGACMLNSLVFPITSAPADDGDSVIDSTDARFVVMGIISFIPYFNWLSWVFAWLDTGRRRYVVYSIVYLVPYLRSNLSLSPEESWLPIASIIFCIIHIQLEASMKNGDFEGFQLFNEAAKHFSSRNSEKTTHLKDHKENSVKGRMDGHRDLPPPDEKSRNGVRGWGVPRDPSKNREQHEDEIHDERK